MIGWLRYRVARLILRFDKDLRICEQPDCYRVFKPQLYGVPYYCPTHDDGEQQ